MDNPDLIVTCIVGDGEAETGPTATLVLSPPQYYLIQGLQKSLALTRNNSNTGAGMQLSILIQLSQELSFQSCM